MGAYFPAAFLRYVDHARFTGASTGFRHDPDGHFESNQMGRKCYLMSSDGSLELGSNRLVDPLKPLAVCDRVPQQHAK